MDIFCPAQTLPLVHVFAPCFTAPSLADVPSSLGALLGVEGRTCLPRLARCAFCLPRALSRWERFLAGYRWSVPAVTARWGTLGVARRGEPRQVPGASLVGPAPPVVAKRATRRRGVHQGQDHSGNAARRASRGGHPWQLAGLRSRWATRGLWWPLGRRLVPGLQGARQGLGGDASAPRRCGEAASAVVLDGTRGVGAAAGRVGAAACDSTAPLRTGRRAGGRAGSSRRRPEAVGWAAPAPRGPGTRGRPPRSGRPWTWARLWRAATPPRERRPRSGTMPAVLCGVRDVGRRDVAQPVRGVGLAGAQEPRRLVRPAVALSARQRRAISGARGSRELPSRDVQHDWGWAADPAPTTLALRRFGPLACLAVWLWRLARSAHRKAAGLQGTVARVSLPAAPLRVQRVRRAWRAWAARQGIVATATPGADVANIERDHEPLLQMLL
jgi:hypothetical protein